MAATVAMLSDRVSAPIEMAIAGFKLRGTADKMTRPVAHPHAAPLPPGLDPEPGLEPEDPDEDQLFIYKVSGDPFSSHTSHSMVAAGGGGKKSARESNIRKARAHHDLGFFPMGVGGARVLQVLVKPTGYIHVEATVDKSAAVDFLLNVIALGGSIMWEMLNDNGGEFSGDYRKRLVEHLIAPLNSAPHSPESHGRAEVAVRIIKRLTKKLLARLGLPLHFWPYVVKAAAEVYNKTPRPDGTSPYSDEHGGEPDLSLLPGDAVVFSDPVDKKVKVGA